MNKAKNSSNSSKGKTKSTKTRNPGQRQGQQKSQSKVVRPERAMVALGNKTFQSRPRYRSMGQSMSVQHSEYITDIIGSALPFAITYTLAMNPGLNTSFPWLNQIASRYESYHFSSLRYRFSTERPTTESGYVALIPDYDPSDAPPINKSIAFQYESTAKCAPWENLSMVSSNANLSKRKSYYVRTGPISADLLPVSDTGNLFVCVGGNSGAVTLGELWCDYEVVFHTPQIDSNLNYDAGKLAGLIGNTPVLPFGTSPTAVWSRTPIVSYNSTNGQLTFLINYQGIMEFTASGVAISATAISGPALSTVVGNAITPILAIYSLVVNAVAGTFLDIAYTATSISGMSVRFGAYPYSYL